MTDYKEILYEKQRGGVLITLESSRSAQRDHPEHAQGTSIRRWTKLRRIRKFEPSS